MFEWVEVKKRPFFFAILFMMTVEVVLVILIAQKEHDEFKPFSTDDRPTRPQAWAAKKT